MKNLSDTKKEILSGLDALIHRDADLDPQTKYERLTDWVDHCIDKAFEDFKEVVRMEKQNEDLDDDFFRANPDIRLARQNYNDGHDQAIDKLQKKIDSYAEE